MNIILGTGSGPTPDITNRSLMIGSSLDSEYIPFFSVFIGKYKSIQGMTYIEYCLPELRESTADMGSSYYGFKRALAYNRQPASFTRYPITYMVFKDTIFYLRDGVPIILMTLIVDWKYTQSTNYLKGIVLDEYMKSRNPGSTVVDSSKFKILIHSEFMYVEHRAFYSYMNKYILRDYRVYGFDTIITNHTDRYIFKPNNLPLSFRTLAIMNNYFEDLTKTSINGFITAG